MMNKKWSLDQNIDNLFFKNDGQLQKEYDAIYASLFKYPDAYIKVVNALGGVRQGLQREEIIRITKQSDNQTFTDVLRDLEECGFGTIINNTDGVNYDDTIAHPGQTKIWLQN